MSCIAHQLTAVHAIAYLHSMEGLFDSSFFLQFYARGLFTSPVLTGISWQSAAVNKPKFMLWRVNLSIHGMIDYPVRHLSGGELLTPEQLAYPS